MNPEQIVTSLAWSKKLKEAGYPQEPTTFIWRTTMEEGLDWHIEYFLSPDALTLYRLREGKASAAPTAEEVLSWLPNRLRSKIFRSDLICMPQLDGTWSVFYDGDNETRQDADSLADASAAMYVCLVENGLIPKL